MKYFKREVFVVLALLLLTYAAVTTIASMTIPPAPTNVSLLSPNNSNLSGNSSNNTVNFICNGSASVATDFIDNVTLVIWNTTNTSGNPITTVYLNTTNSTNGSVGTESVNRSFTVTDIPDIRGMNYSWNCYFSINATGSALEAANYTRAINISHNQSNRTFGMDRNPPVITLDDPSDGLEDYSGYIEFNFTANDTASDIVNCSLWLDGSRNDTIVYGSANASNAMDEDVNGSFKLTLNSTYLKRSLTWYIKCWDNATNKSQAINHIGNSTARYLHTSHGDLTPDYGGGSSPILMKVSGGDSDEGLGDVDAFSGSGESASLGAGESTSFSYGGADHTLEVDEIVDEDTVQITISSDPTTTTLDVGETKHFDLDGDNTKDISVKLVSITDNKANLNFKSYVAPAPTTPTTEDTTEDTTPEPQMAPEEATGISSTWWIIIAAVVVIAVIAYMATKKKK